MNPKNWPFQEDAKDGVIPPIYYEWKTEKRKAKDATGTTARKIRRDPNHPRWNFHHSLLTWWQVRIKLIGTDPEGRRIIVIRPGNGEPIYIRIGSKVELFRAGKKMTWDEDVDETPITAENQRLKGRKRYYAG
jgi:hypothetical protein